MRITPIHETLRRLHNGDVQSSDLARECLNAIRNPSGEGERTFIQVYEGVPGTSEHGLLAGLPISIKDLFDVAGEVTTAGSRVLQNRKPAQTDAVVVQRLKGAGAVIVGRTNMVYAQRDGSILLHPGWRVERTGISSLIQAWNREHHSQAGA